MAFRMARIKAKAESVDGSPVAINNRGKQIFRIMLSKFSFKLTNFNLPLDLNTPFSLGVLLNKVTRKSSGISLHSGTL